VNMAIGETCSREVVCARRDTSVKAAAQLMREYYVGSIVVVDEPNGKRMPAGIVTGRDIAVAEEGGTATVTTTDIHLARRISEALHHPTRASSI